MENAEIRDCLDEDQAVTYICKHCRDFDIVLLGEREVGVKT